MTPKNKRPPRLAEYLLVLMAPFKFDKSAPGDFEEVYHTIFREKGLVKAILWYWWQVSKSIPAFCTDSIRRSTGMLKNYMKIAIRSMAKQKSYSLINISGLSVGIASFMLLMLYVQYEFSFDTYHKNADRIYRVAMESPKDYYRGLNRYAVSPATLAPAMINDFTEVELATRYSFYESPLLSHEEKKFIVKDFVWTDASTFRIFDIPLVSGDVETIFEDPLSIVLSEEVAAKFFGNDDPIGKVLQFDESFQYGFDSQVKSGLKVTGVFKNLPGNSHLELKAAMPFETMKLIQGRDLTDWDNTSFLTYFLLQESADAKTLEAKLPGLVTKYDPEVDEIYFLQKLTDIHLYSKLNFENSVNSDIRYIYLFTSIAFLILIIACINYMNLATSRSAKRGREVGIRKVVGAYRRQLIKQFFGESFFFVLLSLLFSFVLVNSAIPYFNNYIQGEIHLDLIKNVQFAFLIVGLVIFVGLIAGSYPAFYLSAFRPIEVLKGKFFRSSKGVLLRNGLVIFQFSIAVLLIASTLIVKKQLNYVQSKDLGYNREFVLTMYLEDDILRNNIEAIGQELSKNPNILAISGSSVLPHVVGSRTSKLDWEGKDPNDKPGIYYGAVDYDFLDLYEIDILEGRNFSREISSDIKGGFLVNEEAVKVLGLKNSVGKGFGGFREGRYGTIIGVIKDFNNVSLYQPVAPMFFYLAPKIERRNLSIRISQNDVQGSIGFIQDTVESFSSKYPFTYSFLDDIYGRMYTNDRRLGSLFSAFAFLAIFVACLGLFGLASFTAEQRRNEIGVRKVLGAKNTAIVRLLSTEFIKWIIAANMIALPAAYFPMKSWLSKFAYRIELGMEVFLIATSIVIAVAFLTVAYQTLKAAFVSPVNALRAE